MQLFNKGELTMPKIPQEVIDYIKDRNSCNVLSTVEHNNSLFSGVRGRLLIMDEDSIGFCDVAQVKRRPDFEPGQKVAFVVFNPPSFGYQIYGTFLEYCTSGEIFDKQAKMMREGPHNNILEKIGIVKVEEIYSYASEDRTDHGTKIT